MYRVVLFSLVIGVCGVNALDIGCGSLAQEQESGCTEENILEQNSFVLDSLTEQKTQDGSLGRVNISQDLKSVKVIYQKKEFLIERIQNTKERSCPPFCIQKMNIANVQTVGEIETLAFIASLRKQKGTILVDARVTVQYNKDTIPAATNIPYIMLEKGSKHREKIARLLGARKLQKKWYFKNVQKLLVFDNGLLDNQATKFIESLIDIGYPQERILYYRGGVDSWRELGLTLL
jgi:rhodanese-related sulfurtransferase